MTSEFYYDVIMEFLNGSSPDSSSATQTNVATLPLDSTGATTPSTFFSLPSIDKPKEPTLVACERFAFVSKEELSVLSKGVKIVNTTKATSWAVKNCNDRKRAANEQAKEVLVPDDFFLYSNKEIITSILSPFVVETRKTNGVAYPPKTLYQIMCGLLRHMNECNSDCPNFLDKKDNQFRALHSVMDAHFHHLHSNGVGREIKHAKSLSREDEQKLWVTGVWRQPLLGYCTILLLLSLVKCSVLEEDRSLVN